MSEVFVWAAIFTWLSLQYGHQIIDRVGDLVDHWEHRMGNCDCEEEAESLEIAKQIVAEHRAAGLSLPVIARTQSYKKLVAAGIDPETLS